MVVEDENVELGTESMVLTLEKEVVLVIAIKSLTMNKFIDTEYHVKQQSILAKWCIQN